MSSELNYLKFSPLQSFVDVSFWHVLSSKKLNDFKLNEGPHSLYSFLDHVNTSTNSNKLLVDMDSFEKYKHIRKSNIYYLKGSLWTFNTIETFRNIDKNEFLHKFGIKKFLKLVESKEFLNKPDKLCKFVVISFGDLKKYKFYFWFAFPAPVFIQNPIHNSNLKYLNELFTSEQLNQFYLMFEDLQSESKSLFFTLFIRNNMIRIDKFKFFDINDENCILGFCDPSDNPNYPNMLLRNILFAVTRSMIPVGATKLIKILSFRYSYGNGERNSNGSYVMEIELKNVPFNNDDLKFVGWEKHGNKLEPKTANLSNSMNPVQLASNAVDLNLKLMKWRLMPELELNSINSVKCLLLGAGTLGCNVARQLLAWNVGQITLVDNGNVAYSNPVRQSLFTFEQSSSKGPVKKAHAAAESLKRIYPKINVSSYDMSIPMPGHSVNDSEKKDVEANIELLTQLIQSHDVIYLLLDTREARWLPTMLACYYKKLVINAALGFDTYLVMRHGIAPEPGKSPSNHDDIDSLGLLNLNNKEVFGDYLGCYFCTDVVGPANSTRDRTLDQQCTVTRPGVSMIAAALAVEMMVTLIQHPYQARAKVEVSTDDFNFDSCLGTTPHQIRGYLSCFNNVLPFHLASKHCTACSQKILDAYKDDGFEFFMKTFNEHNYLENVCGLSELQSTVDLNCVTALSDSDTSDI